MDLFKELMEMMEEEEKQKNTENRIITPAEYLAVYRKKVKKFCELSVGSHKHNTFTPDHESTLTKTGFYELGNKLRLITSSFDETFTLVEAGAGTGVGSHFMLAGLFAENFPISCISIRIREKEKKAKKKRKRKGKKRRSRRRGKEKKGRGEERQIIKKCALGNLTYLYSSSA